MISDETINQLVHEKIMGKCWHDNYGPKFLGAPFVCSKCEQACIADIREENPPYCSSLDAVVKVIDKLIVGGLDIDIRSELTKGWLVWLHNAGAVKGSQCESSLPKAIAIAALKATGNWPEKGE